MSDTLAEILIVEDEEAIAENIRSILELGRFGARIAHGSAEAWGRIEERRPDLVLLDINLGEERDGIEVAREMQQRCQLPVVFLTAYSDDEYLERARATAPVGFVVKPFEARQLLTMVKVALESGAREQAMRSEAERLAAALRAGGDAVLFSSEGGALVDWNRAAAEWFGLEAAPGGARRFLEDVCALTSEAGADVIAGLFGEVFAKPEGLVAGRGRIRAAAGARDVLYSACGRPNERGLRELVLSLRPVGAEGGRPPAAGGGGEASSPAQVMRRGTIERLEDLRAARRQDARAALVVLTHFFLLRQRYGAESSGAMVASYAAWLEKLVAGAGSVYCWPEAGFLVTGGDSRWLQSLAGRLDRTPLRYEISSPTRSGIVLVSASAKVVDCGRPATLEELAFQLDAIVNAEAQQVEAA